MHEERYNYMVTEFCDNGDLLALMDKERSTLTLRTLYDL